MMNKVEIFSNFTAEVAVTDVESCGLQNHPIHGFPQPIEIVKLPITNHLEDFRLESPIDLTTKLFSEIGYRQLYCPSMPIHPDATKIHGYRNRDLLSYPKSETYKFPASIKYLIAHNANFDHRCLGKPDVKLICTLQLAKTLDKNLKLNLGSHKLDDLLYKFYGEEARPLLKDKHDALSDCIKCVLVLVKLLNYIPNVKTWQGLHEFQQNMKGKK